MVVTGHGCGWGIAASCGASRASSHAWHPRPGSGARGVPAGVHPQRPPVRGSHRGRAEAAGAPLRRRRGRRFVAAAGGGGGGRLCLCQVWQVQVRSNAAACGHSLDSTSNPAWLVGEGVGTEPAPCTGQGMAAIVGTNVLIPSALGTRAAESACGRRWRMCAARRRQRASSCSSRRTAACLGPPFWRRRRQHGTPSTASTEQLTWLSFICNCLCVKSLSTCQE